jgi:hypothetical protein
MRYWRGWVGGSRLRRITPTHPAARRCGSLRSHIAAQPPAKISSSRKRRPWSREPLKNLRPGVSVFGGQGGLGADASVFCFLKTRIREGEDSGEIIFWRA